MTLTTRKALAFSAQVIYGIIAVVSFYRGETLIALIFVVLSNQHWLMQLLLDSEVPNDTKNRD